MDWSDKLHALTRVLVWCLFLELQHSEENKHKNDTPVSVRTVSLKSTYIISFFFKMWKS